MAPLMGTKTYVSQTQFIKDMVQRNKGEQNNNSAISVTSQNIMDYGTFFEPVHRLAMMQLLECNIIETSMIQGQQLLQGCHQSPDGVGVVQTTKFREHVFIAPKWADRQIFRNENLTVLFEQKCPSYRNPVKGMVPEQYIGQVKLGLEVFSICDVGIYTDSVINICSQNQLTSQGFNRCIIPKRFSNAYLNQPKYVGYIQIPKEQCLAIGLTSSDLSSQMNPDTFALVMRQVKANRFDMTYGVYKYSNDPGLKAVIIQNIDTFKYSYMYWKMDDLFCTAVEKSSGFTKYLMMFLAIGRRTLEQAQNKSQDNISDLNPLKTFTRAVSKLHIPMVAENTQDAWYEQNKEQLISIFEQHFSDDWQSFHVFMYLLRDSHIPKYIQLAKKYTQQAIIACNDEPERTLQCQNIIDHLNSIFGLPNSTPMNTNMICDQEDTSPTNIEPDTPQIVKHSPLQKRKRATPKKSVLPKTKRCSKKANQTNSSPVIDSREETKEIISDVDMDQIMSCDETNSYQTNVDQIHNEQIQQENISETNQLSNVVGTQEIMASGVLPHEG